jgi:hypothetical protein
MNKRRISLVALLALALCSPAGADVYKCRTSNGQMEITNTPCPSEADTVKTVHEESISEARRREAEQEVERMRKFVEKREAIHQADIAAERRNDRRQSAGNNDQESGRSIEDCLADLDRQALQPAQRAQMESTCRSNPQQPVNPPQAVYVPTPVVPPIRDSNPLGTCIGNVERLKLPAAERQRRISQCEAGYSVAAQPVAPQKQQVLAPKENMPATSAPGNTTNPGAAREKRPPPCPDGAKNCAHR